MSDHMFGAHITSINLVIAWLSIFDTILELMVCIVMFKYVYEILDIMNRHIVRKNLLNATILELCALFLELELISATRQAALAKIGYETAYRILYLAAAIFVVRAIAITSYKLVWPWIFVTILGIVHEAITLLVLAFKYKPAYVLLKVCTAACHVVKLALARDLYSYLYREEIRLYY